MSLGGVRRIGEIKGDWGGVTVVRNVTVFREV